MNKKLYAGVTIGLFLGSVGVFFVAHENRLKAEAKLRAEQLAQQQIADQKDAELRQEYERQIIKNMIDSNYQSCLLEVGYRYEYAWAIECIRTRYTWNLECGLYDGKVLDERYNADKQECHIMWEHEVANPSQVKPHEVVSDLKWCIAKPGFSGKNIVLNENNSTCAHGTREQLSKVDKAARDLIKAQAEW